MLASHKENLKKIASQSGGKALTFNYDSEI